jgi:hypothetical protein
MGIGRGWLIMHNIVTVKPQIATRILTDSDGGIIVIVNQSKNGTD